MQNQNATLLCGEAQNAATRDHATPHIKVSVKKSW
jgi:hypothetical protein